MGVRSSTLDVKLSPLLRPKNVEKEMKMCRLFQK